MGFRPTGTSSLRFASPLGPRGSSSNDGPKPLTGCHWWKWAVKDGRLPIRPAGPPFPVWHFSKCIVWMAEYGHKWPYPATMSGLSAAPCPAQRPLSFRSASFQSPPPSGTSFASPSVAFLRSRKPFNCSPLFINQVIPIFLAINKVKQVKKYNILS